MWQQAVGACSPGVWADAQTYCAGLTLGGHSWRLPTVTELYSILEMGGTSPYIDATAFPGTPEAGFWSSSAPASPPGVAWIVDFYEGIVYYAGFSCSGRCVR